MAETDVMTKNNALEPIMIEMEIPATPARIWRAWTNEDELTAWLAERAIVRADVGGPFELFWEPSHPERNSTIGCKFTAVQPGELLRFTWKGPVPFADLMNVDPLPTAVTVALQKTDSNETSVRLVHEGWGTGARWQEARMWHLQVWQNSLSRLSKLVSH